MQNSIAICPVADRVPGRLHLVLRGLETEPTWAERLEYALGRLPGVHTICASSASGSVLVRFDPGAWDTEQLVAAVGRALARPWYFELVDPESARTGSACLAVVPEGQPVVRQLRIDGTVIDLARALPVSRRYAGWHQAEVDPLQCALRIGTLCFTGETADPVSEAFARVARRAGLPVDAWLQQFQQIGSANAPFPTCLRRRGYQVLAFGRGEANAVLDRCSFSQDRQGCHALTASLRTQLLDQSLFAPHVVALAYRPLLFQQNPDLALDDWIFSGLASIDWPALRN